MKKMVKNLISILSASVIGLSAIGIGGYHYSTKGLQQPRRKDSEIAVSLHNHTPIFGEKDSALETLVESAFKENIDIVALTDSNTQDNFYYLEKNASKILPEYITQDLGRALKISEKSNPEESIYLIVGYEFHGAAGHVLLIGQEGKIEMNASSTTQDAINQGRSEGAIVIIPHPLATKLGVGGVGAAKLNALYTQADAIESFNAQAICFYPFFADLHTANSEAKIFSEQHGIAGVSDSDAHMASHVGLSYILVEKEEIDFTNGDSIVNSLRDVIRRNEFRNYERYSPWLDSVIWLSYARMKG